MKESLQCWTCGLKMQSISDRPCGEPYCDRLPQTVKKPDTILPSCGEGISKDGKFWADCCSCHKPVGWKSRWDSWWGECPHCHTKGLSGKPTDLDLID